MEKSSCQSDRDLCRRRESALTFAEIAGDAPHDKPEDQADLPREVIADIKEAAWKAILQVQPAGVPEGIYTEVKQGASEPFTSFIDRLTQAVERQCSDELAHPHLLRSLAFANANEECKHLISALPDPQPTLSHRGLQRDRHSSTCSTNTSEFPRGTI